MIELKGDFDFGASRCFSQWHRVWLPGFRNPMSCQHMTGNFFLTHSKPHTKRFTLSSSLQRVHPYTGKKLGLLRPNLISVVIVFILHLLERKKKTLKNTSKEWLK